MHQVAYAVRRLLLEMHQVAYAVRRLLLEMHQMKEADSMLSASSVSSHPHD